MAHVGGEQRGFKSEIAKHDQREGVARFAVDKIVGYRGVEMTSAEAYAGAAKQNHVALDVVADYFCRFRLEKRSQPF